MKNCIENSNPILIFVPPSVLILWHFYFLCIWLLLQKQIPWPFSFQSRYILCILWLKLCLKNRKPQRWSKFCPPKAKKKLVPQLCFLPEALLLNILGETKLGLNFMLLIDQKSHFTFYFIIPKYHLRGNFEPYRGFKKAVFHYVVALDTSVRMRPKLNPW